MTVLLMTAAGAVGALLRYAVSGAVQRSTRSAFPLGTAVVNLMGALLIGLVAGLAEAGSVGYDLGIGFLGGFTTFSTWMVETLRLGLVPRPQLLAVVNLAAILLAGVALAGVGYTLTT